MIRTLITILILSLSTIVYGQNTLPINKLVKLKTPDTEVGDAILFLEDKVDEAERRYIKFFTTYGVIDNIQKQHVALELSFICHSMLGVTNEEFVGGGFYPIAHMEDADGNKDNGNELFVGDQLVPGSDTLYWIDIRNFNWTEQAWENMAREDGYFLEPVVTHQKNGALRLYSGNAVVRADWFVDRASAMTKQSDVDSKTKIYRELLYGTLKAPPKNVSEFEKIWSIDTVKARNIGNTFAALVTKSKNVARHNRILYGYRTELGWYYRTYDVKNQRGKRDYAENILDLKGNPPSVFDGGEIFATNILKLQVYDLYDAKEALTDFGDPTLVRHTSDILSDARVRSPHSCYDCHAAGPIPSENSIRSFLKSAGEAKIYDYKDKLRVNRVVLSNEFDNSVKDNQILFARSLLETNGLTPEDNVKYYLDTINNYNKPLNLEQVAFECGMTVDSFKQAVGEKNKVKPNKVPLRLGLLLTTGEPIERESWDSPGADGQPGIFQQTMIAINGLTTIVDSYEPITGDTVKRLVAIKAGEIMAGQSSLGKYEIGVEFDPTGKVSTGWIGVKSMDGKVGYVREENVRIKQ